MKKSNWQFHSGDEELIGQETKQVTKAFRDPAQLDGYLADLRKAGIKETIQKRQIKVRRGRVGNGKKTVFEYALFREVF